MSNNLDPDQARSSVGPELSQNCLVRFSADDNGRQRVKMPRKQTTKLCLQNKKKKSSNCFVLTIKRLKGNHCTCSLQIQILLCLGLEG